MLKFFLINAHILSNTTSINLKFLVWWFSCPIFYVSWNLNENSECCKQISIKVFYYNGKIKIKCWKKKTYVLSRDSFILKCRIRNTICALIAPRHAQCSEHHYFRIVIATLFILYNMNSGQDTTHIACNVHYVFKKRYCTIDKTGLICI